MRSQKERKERAARLWELRSCGRHGHLTYQPDEADLAAHLSAKAPQGQVWRCLRCGDYVLGEPQAGGPAEDAPVPMRGPQIREAVIMRFLAIERFIRAVILIAAGYGIWKFDGSRNSVQQAISSYLPIMHELSQRMGIDLQQAAPMKLIGEALGAKHSTLLWIAGGVVLYGLIEFLEGVGLWSLQRWGEYVAVVGTSIFLPLEVFEMFHNFTWLKLAGFIVNVALVAWLVWSKRLFGARGGTNAFEAQRHTASIMEITRSVADKSQEPTARAKRHT